MEIRILQKEELKLAAGLSRYVFDACLRPRMDYPQTIAFVEAYITEANLEKLFGECELILWGGFEGEQLVAVSGLQRDGLITMLYVLPTHQNRGYGNRLLKIMREYAKTACGFQRVTVNANPGWTAFYFKKKGFSNLNMNQDMKAPFVPMHASTTTMETYEKRRVPKAVIAFAIIGCILFATTIGGWFMLTYLF